MHTQREQEEIVLKTWAGLGFLKFIKQMTEMRMKSPAFST